MMKYTNALPLAALLAMRATAQYTQPAVCPNDPVVTITGTVTETYCPDCGLTALPSATGAPEINIYGPNINITGPEININLYVFPALGPGGLEDHTYTVTETCPCTADKPPGYIPPGFTTSVTPCDVCGEATPSVTLTCPEATETGSTTYTTVYPTPCSTGGLEDATYVVTEACPCTADRASDYVPQGFVTSSYVVPGPTPSTAIITCPASTATYTVASGGSMAATGGSTASTTAAAAACVGDSCAGTSTASSGVGAPPGTGAGSTAVTSNTWTGTAASSRAELVGVGLITFSAMVLIAAIGF